MVMHQTKIFLNDNVQNIGNISSTFSLISFDSLEKKIWYSRPLGGGGTQAFLWQGCSSEHKFQLSKRNRMTLNSNPKKIEWSKLNTQKIEFTGTEKEGLANFQTRKSGRPSLSKFWHVPPWTLNMSIEILLTINARFKTLMSKKQIG